jgi:multisubunit Na+/H+ antiporter MnhC subunit
MEIAAIVLFAIVGFGLFFFVVKRVLRMAIRLALVGAVLFAVLAGAVAWWWYDPLGGDASNRNQNRNSQTRPARPAR